MDTLSTALPYRLFVGVDTSGPTATAAWLAHEDSVAAPRLVEQSPEGLATLREELLATGQAAETIRVVLMAEGPYWMYVATTCAHFGFGVGVITPSQAHHLARTLLNRPTHESIDAHTLAQLAALLPSDPWIPPPAVREEVRQRLALRDMLADLLQQVRNQLDTEQAPLTSAAVRLRLEALIELLTTQIAEVEAETPDALQEEAVWAAAAQRLMGTTGGGAPARAKRDDPTASATPYEPGVTRLFEQLIKPGMTIVDVGANVGYFSQLAARLAGEQGTVWAFEPTPYNIDILKKNVSESGLQSRIHVVPQAVSNTTGIERFYVNTAAHFVSSLYEEAPKTPFFGQGPYDCIEVPSTTLDSWAAQHGWPSVDLIKMDIEGAEKAALEGMRELSYRNPDLKLIVEFNVITLRAAGVSSEEFFAALHDCGFRRISWVRRLPFGGGPRVLHVPDDIPWLLREARRRSGVMVVNLLCEKSGVEGRTVIQ